MAKVLVSGIINLEVTIKIKDFPLKYTPIELGSVCSMISGCGYNIAKALSILGDDVLFLSMIGDDDVGNQVIQGLEKLSLDTSYILPFLEQTPHSVILYDSSGKRSIYLDPKDLQTKNYPAEIFDVALGNCELAALGNVEYSRPFLHKALQLGKLIATDVHTINDLEDDYNRDFMRHAHILFMSDEHLPCSPEDWLKKVLNRYGPEIAVIGLGSEGVLLSVKSDGYMGRFPAVKMRKVVNTVGAGDALFSAFIYFYQKNKDPYMAIKKAIIFASYKIGAVGAAEGFLDEASINNLYNER